MDRRDLIAPRSFDLKQTCAQAYPRELATHMARMQESGADQGTRTPNPRITSAVRYQLRQVGLEPCFDQSKYVIGS